MDAASTPTMRSDLVRHSIGRWEGDTLVIDTVGYNDKFWFDSRGTPHTEKLHTIDGGRAPLRHLINEFPSTTRERTRGQSIEFTQTRARRGR